jgi:hypothetical protein
MASSPKRVAFYARVSAGHKLAIGVGLAMVGGVAMLAWDFQTTRHRLAVNDVEIVQADADPIPGRGCLFPIPPCGPTRCWLPETWTPSFSECEGATELAQLQAEMR